MVRVAAIRPSYFSCWFSSFKKFSNKDIIDFFLRKFWITPINDGPSWRVKFLTEIDWKTFRLLVQVKRVIVRFQVMFTANKVNLWFDSWSKPNSRNWNFRKFQILCVILKTQLGKVLYGPFELSNNLHGIGSHSRIFRRMLTSTVSSRHKILVSLYVSRNRKNQMFDHQNSRC